MLTHTCNCSNQKGELEGSEFKASTCYSLSSRTAWAARGRLLYKTIHRLRTHADRPRGRFKMAGPPPQSYHPGAAGSWNPHQLTTALASGSRNASVRCCLTDSHRFDDLNPCPFVTPQFSWDRQGSTLRPPKAQTDTSYTELSKENSSLRSVRLPWLLRLRVPVSW